MGPRKAVETAKWLRRGAEKLCSARIKAHLSRRRLYWSQRLSCWRGRCPQPGDQRQDVGEHLSRHRDLGHLESDVGAWLTTFAPTTPAPSSVALPAAPSPPPMMMQGPGDHIEGDLAFLTAELKISAAQEKYWDAFAKVVREDNQEITDAMRMPAATGGHPMTVEDTLDLHAKALKTRLSALNKLSAALEPLYAALSSEQKTAADQLIPMHLAMLMM